MEAPAGDSPVLPLLVVRGRPVRKSTATDAVRNPTMWWTRPARPTAPATGKYTGKAPRKPWSLVPFLEQLEDRNLLIAGTPLQALTLPPADTPPSATPAGASKSPSISDDGLRIAYQSLAFK